MWEWIKNLGKIDDEQMNEHLFVLSIDEPSRPKVKQVIKHYGGLPPLLPPPEDRRYDN